jgi:hypothetical protein
MPSVTLRHGVQHVPERNCSFHRTRSAPRTSSARSTVRGARGPLVASPFLQSGAVKPARPSCQNGPATARPPVPVGLLCAAARFPLPRAVTSVAAGAFRVGQRATRATGAPARSLIGHVEAAAHFPPARVCAASVPAPLRPLFRRRSGGFRVFRGFAQKVVTRKVTRKVAILGRENLHGNRRESGRCFTNRSECSTEKCVKATAEIEPRSAAEQRPAWREEERAATRADCR